MPQLTPHYMLLTSLPHLPPLLQAKRLPMSLERLQWRLRMLPASQRAETHRLRQVLSWEELSTSNDDEFFLAARRLAPSLSDPTLREAVRWRLDVRMLVAALRQRHLGLPPPAGHWAVSRYAKLVTKHWQKPNFSLGSAFPWLPRAEQLLAAGQTLELEELLLTTADRKYRRLARGQGFSYARVGLYLLRWQLLERWLSYEQAQAQVRFERLLEQTIAGLPELAEDAP